MEVFEQAGTEEQEAIITQGIGLIIINAITGQILSMREQTDDLRTLRRKGELSIPLETRKNGESAWENLCGAMAEIADDDISPYVRSCFFRTSDEYIYNGYSIKVNGRSIHCDIAVLIYDGPDIQFKPHTNETSDVEWINPLEFFAQGNTRLFAKLAVRETLRRSIYLENLSTYRDFPNLRIPVFDGGLSIQRMYRDREQLVDMK